MKSALVTGGSRGIGRAICAELARQGYYVLINYKSNQAEAEQTLNLVQMEGENGELLPFDVANQEDTRRVLGAWLSNNADKNIEVLVNNAGIRNDALFGWMEDEQWSSVLNTNLNSFFHTTRLILSQMQEQRYGRIINIVSLSGLKGMPGQTNYSAAKAGVIGATKALAQEVARSGITVNAIAPGFIKTDMTNGMDEKELRNLVPARRFGKPEEVAYATAFLASDKAGYITGQVLSVNGGLYS